MNNVTMGDGVREIKFRAWDGKEMVYNACWFEWIGEKEYDGIPVGNYYRPSMTHMHMQALMQYAGIKDFEEREIYEGDLYKDAFGNVAKVVFTTHTAPTVFGAGFAGEMLSDGSRAPLQSGVKVIGNIYENPELLEGEK